MFGCLTLPFRIAGALLLIGALLGLWLYRDRALEVVHGLMGGGVQVEAAGRPEAEALAPAEQKLRRLAAGRADSVVLTAGETATLLLERLDPRLRRQLDQVEVRLGENRLRLAARLNTTRIPRGVFGPLNAVVRDVEPVALGGPVTVRGPGRAEWEVREADVRGLPLPTPLVRTLVQRALDDSTATGIPLTLPAGVHALRLSTAGLILYARPRP